MATFQAQVEGLTSLSVGTTPTTTELSTFLTDGAREIINILPPSLQEYCIGATSIDNTSTTLAIHSKTAMGKILYVTRESSTGGNEKLHSPQLISESEFLAEQLEHLYIENGIPSLSKIRSFFLSMYP